MRGRTAAGIGCGGGNSSGLALGAEVEVGVAMLFNPTDAALPNQTIAVPLYYTGLERSAGLSLDGAAVQQVPLRRDYSVLLTLDMPARSVHTLVVTSTEFGG